MKQTIKQALLWGQSILKESGFETPRLDCEILLSFLLNKNRVFFYTYPETVLDEIIDTSFKDLVLRRKEHEPIAYIVGEKDFMDLTFLVTKDVLIPRPETEILVEETLKFIKENPSKTRILDIGTGSGAIGLSLKHALNTLNTLNTLNASKEYQITAIDINPLALKVAEENAKRFGLSVEFILMDIFDTKKLESLKNRFDIIVSNPPYIDQESELSDMAPETLKYEPHSALFAKNNGLSFYEHIASISRELFCDQQGALFLEIGHEQRQSIEKILKTHGFENLSCISDLSGKDRVIKGIATFL